MMPKEITEEDYEFYNYLRADLDMSGDDVYYLYVNDYAKLEQLKREWKARRTQ